MSESEIITALGGRRFENIGWGIPKKDDWFITPISRRARQAEIDFTSKFELLRELPADRASNPVQEVRKMREMFKGVTVTEEQLRDLRGSEQPKPAAQPGEAITENYKLQELLEIWRDYGRAVDRGAMESLRKWAKKYSVEFPVEIHSYVDAMVSATDSVLSTPASSMTMCSESAMNQISRKEKS